mmetsp:Transcript_521/g.749  ORF Transcript_521/g.749 Transcript_521/m.749 type:complete len:91 (-) Transcript_521:75-347(-)
MVVFVDEVGGDTSQEGDGAVGGQKRIVPRGTVPKESAATNTNHFTMLGFTAATGEPVSFEGKKFHASSLIPKMDPSHLSCSLHSLSTWII